MRYKQAGTVLITMTITQDEDVLGGEPRIDDTRISVRHVAARVIESGRDLLRLWPINSTFPLLLSTSPSRIITNT